MKIKELINELKRCDPETMVDVSIESSTDSYQCEIDFISIGDETIPNFINVTIKE